MDIRSLIRKIPDSPSRGDTYYDLTTLLADGPGFHAVIELLSARYAPRGIKKFACMEWRGFVIGAALAHRLGAGFVPIRKLGKLPGETISREHEFGQGISLMEHNGSKLHTAPLTTGHLSRWQALSCEQSQIVNCPVFQQA